MWARFRHRSLQHQTVLSHKARSLARSFDLSRAREPRMVGAVLTRRKALSEAIMAFIN